MANIALDIKANTSKALGEFKKLSRELDNKFLVQGLKLDVVKNAFKQINREFESSVGEQGFGLAESTNQIQRSAAANLAALNKLSVDASLKLTKSLKSNLQELQAEGRITGEAVKEALGSAGFFEFGGSEAEISAQFNAFTQKFAKFATDSKDIFSESGAGQLQKVITGRADVGSLYGLDFGLGGGGGNLIADYFRTTGGVENFNNLSAEVRTQVIKQFFEDAEDTNTKLGEFFDKANKQARADDPFRYIQRDIQALFSPKGIFGPLKVIENSLGEAKIKNFDGTEVDRNLIQVTARLIRTIFDKDKGLFAVLFKEIGDALGVNPENILAPILNGVEFFTSVLEKLRDFFQSPAFKKILTIFEPLKKAIDGVENKNLTAITPDELNGLVDGVFESVRAAFTKLAGFIRNIDVSTIGSIVGNLINEIVKTLPSIIRAAAAGIGKAIEAIGAILSEVDDGAIGGILAAVLDGLGEIIVKSIPVILLIIVKAFEALAGAFTQTGLAGKVLIFGAITEFFTRIFTGQGAISKILEPIRNGFARIFEKFTPAGRDRGKGLIDSRFSGFEGRVVAQLNTIIRLLGGKPLTDGPGGSAPSSSSGRGRDGPRRGTPGRDGRTARERARNIQRIRNSRGITGNVPRIRGGKPFGRGLDLAQSLFRNLRINQSAYTNPIGPLPLSSQAPWAAAPGGGFTPLLQSAARPGKFTQARNAVEGFSRGVAGRASSALSGVARKAGGALKRVPLLGPLVAGLRIASILGTPGAKAEELEGLTPEEKREQKRQEERQKTRGVLGVLGGVAGGAAGGAAIGTLVGGPVGTLIGGVIGGILGEEAVKFLSDPIIDGITDFGKEIGSVLSGLWQGTTQVFGDGWKSVTAFFGPEGPIQSTFRFITELPGNMVDGIKTGFENIKEKITSLPETIWNSITKGFGSRDNDDPVTKRFLGGAGRGMTLVGENGPELVNLGSGSVVTPMTSFAGLGLSQGGSTRQPINNIVINVNAPGANEFANQLSEQVLEKIEDMYKETRSTMV